MENRDDEWLLELSQHLGRDSWALLAIDLYDNSPPFAERRQYLVALAGVLNDAVSEAATGAVWAARMISAVSFEMTDGDKNFMLLMIDRALERVPVSDSELSAIAEALAPFGLRTAQLDFLVSRRTGEARDSATVVASSGSTHSPKAIARQVSEYEGSGVVSLGEEAGSCDVFILTILQVEYDAVVRRISNARLVRPRPGKPNLNLWKSGAVTAVNGSVYQVIVARAHEKGPLATASALLEGIRRFQPRVALLVGVAGGMEELRLGDAVIGTVVNGYEYGRVTERGFEQKLDWTHRLLGPVTTALQQAQPGWTDLIDEPMPPKGRRPSDGKAVALVSGIIASGDKTLEDLENDVAKALLGFLKSIAVKAVEMEAVGAGHAINQVNSGENAAVQLATVRGISDLPYHEEQRSGSAGKSVREDWKPFASDVAATLAVEAIRNAWPYAPFEETAS